MHGDLLAKIAISAAAAAGMTALLAGARERAWAGSNDFMPLYLAAQLTTGPDLYRPDPYIEFQTERFGMANPAYRFTRPPFYSLLLAPLGRMDYRTAYLVWHLARLAALVAFVLLWPAAKSRADTMLWICLSLPMYIALLTAQDVLFLLPLAALAVRWEKSRPFLAGLTLSFGAIKFHLLVLLPLLLLAQRRWDIARGFAAGAALFVGMSFVAGGWSWPLDYYLTLADGRVHPDVENMPNLHGAGLPPAVEWLAAALVVVGAWLAMRRTDFEAGIALALTGGLLVSYHAYSSDAVLLAPALMVVLARAEPEWLRLAAVVFLSPVPSLMLLAGRPAALGMQLGLAALYAAIVWWAAKRGRVLAPAPPLTARAAA